MRKTGKTLATALGIKSAVERGKITTLVGKDCKNIQNILESMDCFYTFTEIKKDGETTGYNIIKKVL